MCLQYAGFYLLYVLRQAHDKFETRAGKTGALRGEKTGPGKAAIARQTAAFSAPDIRDACPCGGWT